MANSYSVQAILSATDKNFSSTLKNALGVVNKLGTKVGSFAFGAMAGAGAKAFNAIASGASDVVTEINASNKAWKTFDGNMKILGKSEGEINSVKKSLQSFAEQSIYSSSDMASTYAQLASVGTKSADKLVTGFGGLAAAAENPTQAMKTLSQQAVQMAAKPNVAWADFKLMLEQTPAGIAAVAKEMGMSTSEMVTAVQDGKIKTEDFFDAINKVGNSQSFQKLATSYKSVDEAMDGLKETLGNKLTPAFDVLSQVGIKAIEGIMDKLGSVDAESLAKKVESVVDTVSRCFNVMKSAFSGVGTEIKEALSAVGDALGITMGEFSKTDIIQGFAKACSAVANAIKGVANFIEEHASTIGKLAPVVAGVAAAFMGFKAVNSIAPGLTNFAGALAKMAGKGIAGLAAKLFGISFGQRAVGTASVTTAASVMKSAVATLALGAAVALAAVGLALLVQSAIALANAGWPAVAALVGLVGVIALLAVGAAAIGPALTASAIGLVAFGAAIALVGVGAILAAASLAIIAGVLPTIAAVGAQGAVAIAQLGLGMTVFAVGAALAGAACIVLGAGLLLIGAAIVVAGAGMLLLATAALVAAAAMALLSVAMPTIATYGTQAATAMIALGGGLAVFAAGATLAGVAAIALGAGLLVVGAGLLVAGAAVLVLAAGFTLLSAAAMLGAAALMMLSAVLPAIAANGTAGAAAIAVLGAGLLVFAAGAAVAGAAAIVLGAGILVCAAGLTVAAAAALLLGTGVMMIGTGAMMAAAGLSVVGAVLPIISEGGAKSAAALLLLGAGLTAFSAPALAAGAAAAALGAGFVVATAGAITLAASCTLLGAGAMIASVGILALSGVLPLLIANSTGCLEAFTNLAAGMTAIAGPAAVAGAAAAVLGAGMLVAAGSSAALVAAISALSAMLSATGAAMKKCGTSATSLGAAFPVAAAGAMAMNNSVLVLIATLNQLSQTAITVMLSVIAAFNSGAALSFASGRMIGQGLRDGLSSMQRPVMAMSTHLTAIIAKDLRAGYSGSYAAGQYIGLGLANGLRSMAGAVEGAAAALCSTAFGEMMDEGLAGMKLMKTALMGIVSRMEDIANATKSAELAMAGLYASLLSCSNGIVTFGTNAQTAMLQVTTAFNNAAAAALISGQMMGTNLSTGLQSTQPGLLSVCRQMTSAAVTTLRSAYGQFFSVGAYLGEGLVQGLLSKLGAVQAAAARLAAAAAAALAAAAQVASPSKLTMKLGAFVGEGFAIGMEDQQREVWKAAEKLVNIPSVATPKMAMAYSGEMSADYDYYRNAEYVIEVPLSVDGKEFAKATASYTQEELDKRQTRENRKHGKV